MKSLLKDKAVQVLLSDQEHRDLARAVELEMRRRGERVAKGALLRELAMPRVREIVAAGDQVAA